MWLDDEGMHSGVNGPATCLARWYGFTWQPYFGTVVLTGGADADGNVIGLGAGDAAAIRGLLG